MSYQASPDFQLSALEAVIGGYDMRIGTDGDPPVIRLHPKTYRDVDLLAGLIARHHGFGRHKSGRWW